MYALLERPAIRGTLACLVVLTLLLMPMHQPVQGKPVVQVIVVAIGFGLVGVGVACLTQWLDICKSGDGDGGSSTAGGGGGGAGDAGGAGGAGGNGGNGGGIQESCRSADNACGNHGTGFIVNGICNATVPLNSDCPVPVIGEVGFYAEPDRVRSGNQTTLYWDVSNATTCSLTGGDLTLPPLGIVGEQETNDITAATTFTLTCSNGGAVDSPQTSQQTNVTLVPSFEEI